MLEWVKALEGKEALERREWLMRSLTENAVPFTVHEFKMPGRRGANLIVQSGAGAGPAVLVTAHYDSVAGTPGANDNASSVAVLLNLCLALKSSQCGCAVKMIFFDGEEPRLRFGPFRLGCYGSRAYLRDHGSENIAAAYNLEWCGEGDLVGIWPVNARTRQTAAFKILQKVLEEKGSRHRAADLWPLIVSSDHSSFRHEGIEGSFSLSILPESEAEALERFFSSRWEAIRFLLSPGNRLRLQSSLFRRLHTLEDRADYLDERSLRMAFEIVRDTLAAWGRSEII